MNPRRTGGKEGGGGPGAARPGDVQASGWLPRITYLYHKVSKIQLTHTLSKKNLSTIY